MRAGAFSRHNLVVLNITAFLVNFGTQLFQPFVALYLRALGATVTEVGLAYVGIVAAMNVSGLLGGFLADAWGRKRVLVLGNAIGFLLLLALVDAGSWLIAAAVLFALTLFLFMVTPASYSAIAESSSTEDERTRGSAFGLFATFVALGLALGGVAGGLVPNPGHFQFNFIASACTGLFVVCLQALFFKETLRAGKKLFATNLRATIGAMPRTVWLLMVALVLDLFASEMYTPFYPLYSTGQLGFSELMYAIMVGAGFAGSAMGALLTWKLAKKVGAKRLMLFGTVTAWLLVIPWLYVSNLVAASFFFAASGFFTPLYVVGGQTLLSGAVAEHERGMATGFVLTASGLISMAAPYVGSQLWVGASPQAPFMVSVALAVLAAIPIALVPEVAAKA